MNNEIAILWRCVLKSRNLDVMSTLGLADLSLCCFLKELKAGKFETYKRLESRNRAKIFQLLA